MAHFHGLFDLRIGTDGRPELARSATAARAAVPDPSTGRLLQVSTIEARVSAICPQCATTGLGGYVSFEADLRLAYACPNCRELVWLAGA